MTILETVILILTWVLGVICGLSINRWVDKPLTDAELRMEEHLMELDEFEEKLK